MKRFRKGRRNPRIVRIAFGVVAAGSAVLLAACSSSSSSSTSSAQSTASSSSSSSSSGANISALQADVAKAAATPSFSDYMAQYGGKIPSIANLAGKKIMIIPGVS
jgi:ABC-type Fe3+-hydroxamate transport system substrate-binding protein